MKKFTEVMNEAVSYQKMVQQMAKRIKKTIKSGTHPKDAILDEYKNKQKQSGFSFTSFEKYLKDVIPYVGDSPTKTKELKKIFNMK